MSQFQLVVNADRPLEAGLDLIVTHGVITAGLPHLPDGWHEPLLRIAPANTRILGYDADLQVDEKLDFQAFHERSTALFTAICLNCKPEQRPLVIIGYGLAGMILKQALYKLSQVNRHHRYLESTRGIIFLATPHLTRSDAPALKTLSKILRYESTTSWEGLFTKADLSSLAFDAWNFEELKLDCPVLSCYEECPVKIRRRGRSRRLYLVDKPLVRTRSAREQVVAIDTPLRDILKTTESVIHRHISRLLDDALRKADDTSSALEGPSPPLNENLLPLDAGGNATTRLTQPVIEPATTTPSPNTKPSSPFLSPHISLELRTPSTRNSASGTSSPFVVLSRQSTSQHSGGSDPTYVMVPFENGKHRVPESVEYLQARSHSKPNPDFCGRDAVLRDMDRNLLPAMSTPMERPNVFVLCGPAGMGKTQIALHYFHSRKRHFHILLWIQANSSDTLSTAFAQISVKLNLEDRKDQKDAVVSRDLVLGWLMNPFQTPGDASSKHLEWLLIFDNADNPDILHEFWPFNGQGSVIVTTRDPLTKSPMCLGNCGEDLEGLSEEDAVNLLRHLLQLNRRQVETDDQLLRIVQKVHCWPLAIVQMASAMCRRRLSPSKFLEIYENEVDKAEVHSTKGLIKHGYPLTLTASWALKDMSLEAAQLLSVISLLFPSVIQEEILITAPEQANLPSFPTDSGLYSRACSYLESCSIISRKGGSSPDDPTVLTIHPLIQDVVRGQLLTNVSRFVTVFNGTVRLLGTVWPFETLPFYKYHEFNKIQRRDRCDRILPHLQQLRKMYGLLSAQQRPHCATEDFLNLLSEVSWCHFQRSDPEKSLDYLQATLKCHQDCPDDHPRIVASQHGTWSSIGTMINDPSLALEQGVNTLALRERVWQESQVIDSQLTAAYTELGRAMIMNGMFTEAKENIEKSISLRKQMTLFSRLQLYSPLLYLSWIDLCQGNLESASETLLEALRDREATYGKDDCESNRTGVLLFYLGTVYSKQGLFDQALEYHSRALSLFRVQGGELGVDSGRASYQLGLHYYRLNNLDFALRMVTQAIKVFGRSRYLKGEYARASKLQSVILQAMSFVERANDVLDEAVKTRRELVEGDARSAKDLQDADFDEVIVVWNR